MLPKQLPVEVMCHGDFAPYNITFVDGCVHGIIDFDTLQETISIPDSLIPYGLGILLNPFSCINDKNDCTCEVHLFPGRITL